VRLLFLLGNNDKCKFLLKISNKRNITWRNFLPASVCGQWRTEGGLGSLISPPHPEIPKFVKNRSNFSPIVKTVKNS